MSKQFEQGQWVKMKWQGVYPEWTGTVLSSTDETTTVNFLRRGVVDVPTRVLHKTRKPKERQ